MLSLEEVKTSKFEDLVTCNVQSTERNGTPIRYEWVEVTMGVEESFAGSPKKLTFNLDQSFVDEFMKTLKISTIGRLDLLLRCSIGMKDSANKSDRVRVDYLKLRIEDHQFLRKVNILVTGNGAATFRVYSLFKPSVGNEYTKPAGIDPYLIGGYALSALEGVGIGVVLTKTPSDVKCERTKGDGAYGAGFDDINVEFKCDKN